MEGRVVAVAAVGFAPDFVAVLVELDQQHVGFAAGLVNIAVAGVSGARDHKAVVAGLHDRISLVVQQAAKGFFPNQAAVFVEANHPKVEAAFVVVHVAGGRAGFAGNDVTAVAQGVSSARAVVVGAAERLFP
ncbi:hypothetical protein, partial [Halochromatium sp.]